MSGEVPHPITRAERMATEDEGEGWRHDYSTYVRRMFDILPDVSSNWFREAYHHDPWFTPCEWCWLKHGYLTDVNRSKHSHGGSSAITSPIIRTRTGFRRYWYNESVTWVAIDETHRYLSAPVWGIVEREA